jgi:hypothetical protein
MSTENKLYRENMNSVRGDINILKSYDFDNQIVPGQRNKLSEDPKLKPGNDGINK